MLWVEKKKKIGVIIQYAGFITVDCEEPPDRVIREASEEAGISQTEESPMPTPPSVEIE